MVFSADLRLKEREAVLAFLGSGSEDTFRGLFEALYPKLVSYFAVRGLDIQVAEELAQDVLMTPTSMRIPYARRSASSDGCSGWPGTGTFSICASGNARLRPSV